jgi:hypothetical protein
MVGWRVEGQPLDAVWDAFRKRGDSKDGVPVALKESTHLYLPTRSVPAGSALRFHTESVDAYPLFSIDLYTAKMPQYHKDLVRHLEEAVVDIDKQLPDLMSMHVLRSADSLSAIVLGVWNSLYGYEGLQEVENYQTAVANAKKLAIEGSLSDIMDKTKPNRIYYVNDILLA